MLRTALLRVTLIMQLIPYAPIYTINEYNHGTAKTVILNVRRCEKISAVKYLTI
jgi:hypothetical protein